MTSTTDFNPDDTSLLNTYETYFRTYYPKEPPSPSELTNKVIKFWKENYPRLPSSKELELVIKKVYYPKLKELEDKETKAAHDATVNEEKRQKHLRGGSTTMTRRMTISQGSDEPTPTVCIAVDPNAKDSDDDIPPPPPED